MSEDWVHSGPYMTPGGCTFYRCMLPANVVPGALVGRIAWTASGGFGVRINNQQARFGLDVVVFKQIMHRWIPKQMRAAQALGQRIIVDIDDAFDHLHEANQAKKLTDPALNRVANRDYLRQVVELADMIVCSTPFLYEYYSTLHPNVRMVRNGVNPDMFPVRPVTGRKPVLGWAGALQWRSNDAETLRPWLNDFLHEHDLMFHHAGDMPEAPKFHELAGVDIDRMLLSPMRPLPQYPEMLDFDIGLVPLSFIDFNEAKSNLKGLEYAASGIPFVAAATGEYRLLAASGVGAVAATPEDWVREVSRLLPVTARKRASRTGRAVVERDWSIQARSEDWVGIFTEYRDVVVDVPTATIPYREALP